SNTTSSGWTWLSRRRTRLRASRVRWRRWDDILEGGVERQHLPGDLGPNGARVVALLHVAVALEQVDDWEVGRGLAIRHHGPVAAHPPRRVVAMHDPIAQAPPPPPRLPDHGHDLTMPRSGPLQGLLECRQLLLPSHEACQPTRCAGL